MTYDQLVDFVERRMRMSHIYQPVMLLTLLQSMPKEILTLLVGLALLGPLTGALTNAYALPESRFAATVTLAVTASGLALFGVGAAFWGLLAGLAMLTLEHTARRLRA